MYKNNMKASECKCIECGEQAVAFWPCCDPDIPSHPYCRKCLDKTLKRVLMEMHGYDEETAEEIVKLHKIT